MYKIVYANTIDKKWLKKQSAEFLQRIKKEIETKLVYSPELFGKPLRKSLKGYRRLRVGASRILFKILPEEKIVQIVFIGKKPDVYEQYLKQISN